MSHHHRYRRRVNDDASRPIIWHDFGIMDACFDEFFREAKSSARALKEWSETYATLNLPAEYLASSTGINAANAKMQSDEFMRRVQSNAATIEPAAARPIHASNSKGSSTSKN